MGIKRTLDNTTDMVKYFGNTAWDVINSVYANLQAITDLAASLGSVDSFLAQSSIAVKVPVITATTTNIVLSGVQTVDGISLTDERILVKNQTDESENGIYKVNAGTWTRELDWDGADGVIDIIEGTLIPVNRGTVNENTMWKITTQTDPIVIGTTNIQFALAPHLADLVTEDVTWCPGYTFGFVDTNTFTIDGFDVTNLFSAGRRLKFSIGIVNIYGAISSSTFSTDTTVEMTLETDVLTDVAYEVCFVAGNTSWSPIALKPFSGGAINSIATGVVNSVEYWVVCSVNGQVAHSTDMGVTWTAATIVTTEDLWHVQYDSDDEVFFIAGDAGVILYSLDGVTWIEESTNIAALTTGTGTGDVHGLHYSTGDQAWWAMFHYDASDARVAYTLNRGVTWTVPSTNINTININPANQLTTRGISSSDINILKFDGSTSMKTLAGISDTSWGTFTTLSSLASSVMGWYDSAIGTSTFAGLANGNIIGLVGFTGDDTTTTSKQINGFARSETNDRTVAVAHDGIILYLEDADATVNNSWTLVSNGFNPLTDILCVARNETDGVFIAGSRDGTICRSTNGTN